ncbi:MAG: cation transporter [Candidatus Methylumidiphilus sp.]
MSIAKEIVLRYRSEGHLRFSIPSGLCQSQAKQQLETALLQAEGVYRVDFYLRQGKLAIRYIEGVTDFQAVAKALFNALKTIDLHSPCCAGGDIALREKGDAGNGWLKAKIEEAKETITALGIVTRGGGDPNTPILSADHEKFMIEFFTDLLVLYLIKLHWHLIMGHWIRNPWQYRSEWMATIYMIFLLVRSKKPKQ